MKYFILQKNNIQRNYLQFIIKIIKMFYKSSLSTLLNLFQENEQYEKCAIVKRRLDIVNDILKKYDDEI